MNDALTTSIAKKRIFISYRRDGGIDTARWLHDQLKARGYHVFIDMEGLRAGAFNQALYHEIKNSDVFLLVLSKGSLDRCKNKNDWVRKELAYAIQCGLNIIPVMKNDFEFPSKPLPSDISTLPYYNGIRINFDFFDAFMDKLEEYINDETGITPMLPPHTSNLFSWKKVAIFIAVFALLATSIAIISRPQQSNQEDPPPSTDAKIQIAETEPSTHAEDKKSLDNVLMKNAYSNAETEQNEPAFNTEAIRKEVGTITFLDSQDATIPQDAADASLLQNGSVRAWAVKSGNFYDIFIAADGGIYAPEDSSSLFREMINLTEINFNNVFFTDNAETMEGLFAKCEKLKKLDLSQFNTANVESFFITFYRCCTLTELDVSSFNTEKATNMRFMFSDCSQLKELNLRSFNTENVTTMDSMFLGCEQLQNLDITSFDTQKVTTTRHMFSQCTQLQNLDLSSFHTENVMDMNSMFYGCAQLTDLDLSSFDTENVTDMSCAFMRCSQLKELDISNFNTVNVTNMEQLFCECTQLQELDLRHFNTANVEKFFGMFYNCTFLTDLDLSNFITEKATDMGFMFGKCAQLQSLDVSNFNTEKVTNMNCMFADCSSLQNLDVSSFNTSNVTDMGHMFYNCSQLKELDISNFDTSKVTSVNNMLKGSGFQQNVDIRNWDLSAVTISGGFMDDDITVNGKPWKKLFPAS